MQESVIDNIINKFFEVVEESIFFCFQGGEPLLAGINFFSRVIELQTKNNLKNIKITNSIQTNGTLIDEEWCRFFKDNNILVGVSLDGIRNTHNLYRHFSDGSDSFDTVTKNLKLLKEYGVDFNILTVVNKDTAINIEEIYRYYKECDYDFQQYIVCRDPLFSSKGEEKYSLLPKEYGEFLIKLFDLWSQDFETGRAPYIRQFENYINIILGGGVENCEQCGNCGVTYAIDANGDVFPCDFYMLDEYRLGNINENSIEQIDNRRSDISFINKSTQFSNNCRECKFLGICRNGCQRNRQTDIQGKYINYFCEGYSMFFSQRIEQLISIARGLENNG